ncbi:hypothetical protein Ciccas_010349 [Cichlidogyrus casuarinus]|uniref:Uncharacterized protein n=1 Tax=Cichlidogyrus casuarinus TaxID=1844966 RepID=A0ABD2PZ03_9PLAT
MTTQQRILQAKLALLENAKSNCFQVHRDLPLPSQMKDDRFSQWVVRKRSDGSKYITKRPIYQSHKLLENAPPLLYHRLKKLSDKAPENIDRERLSSLTEKLRLSAVISSKRNAPARKVKFCEHVEQSKPLTLGAGSSRSNSENNSLSNMKREKVFSIVTM